MADLYNTSVQDILAGFECNTRKDGNPYAGEQVGSDLRYYKGVKSYDIVSHGEEQALLFVVTDYHMILVVAKETKLTDMCSACVAEDANYHYENRNGKIVLRADDKGKLVKRLLEMDWSYVEPEEDDSEEEAEDQFDIEKEADRQAALDQAQADLEAQRKAQNKAKADAIAAARRRAEAEEAAAKAAADATAQSKTPAVPKPTNAANHRIDVGDLSEFE